MIIKKTNKNLSEVVKFLNKGGVVICPTDTVYGFLADAENKKAVAKIYKIKKRPTSKRLPLFVKDLKMANQLAEIDDKQKNILKNKWPGKFTFVLACHSRESGNPVVIARSKATKQSIALRIPKYKFLNNLLKKINKPLAQTSANISGQPALAKISDIVKQFDKSDILIIDGGDLKKSKPSKIIDLTRDNIKILR
jgi:L-threonylcarbamoyladenylate synthase